MKGVNDTVVKVIGIFSGTGSVLYTEVERALKSFRVTHRRVGDDLSIDDLDVLIIPGGYTVDMWEPLYRNREKIYEFLDSGGIYVGICAGAYLAPETVVLRTGRLPGLGIIDVENVRKSGTGMVQITLLPNPLTSGLPSRIMVWYQNGPHIDPKDSESIAVFDDGYSAIVRKDNVILFSVHPEGNVESGAGMSVEGMRILLRAIGVEQPEKSEESIGESTQGLRA